MELVLIEVNQGNGYGQSIKNDSDEVLRTTDLVGCIAVLIIGPESSYMIHSDSNRQSGKGKISLIHGILSLGLNSKEHVTVGLIGGETDYALQEKFKEVKKVLPNATLTMSHPMVDAAYLTSTGIMAYSKRNLAEKLQLDVSEIEFTGCQTRGMSP